MAFNVDRPSSSYSQQRLRVGSACFSSTNPSFLPLVSPPGLVLTVGALRRLEPLFCRLLAGETPPGFTGSRTTRQEKGPNNSQKCSECTIIRTDGVDVVRFSGRSLIFHPSTCSTINAGANTLRRQGGLVEEQLLGAFVKALQAYVSVGARYPFNGVAGEGRGGVNIPVSY